MSVSPPCLSDEPPPRTLRNGQPLPWKFETQLLPVLLLSFKSFFIACFFSSSSTDHDLLTHRTVWAVSPGEGCCCSYAYGNRKAAGSHTGERCWSLLGGIWRAVALFSAVMVCRWRRADICKLEPLRRYGVVCCLAQLQRGPVWVTWRIEGHRLVESWVSCGTQVEASVLLEPSGGFVLASSW